MQGAARHNGLAGRTVFLTGATGEIGGELLRRFLDAGVRRVYCLVRANGTSPEARLGVRLGAPAELDSRVVPLLGDIATAGLGLGPEALDALTSETELIFHCAATTSFLKKAECWTINVGGVRNLLALLPRFARAPRLFYFGSPSASGDFRDTCVHESDYPRPGAAHLAEYSASKAAAEAILLEQGADHDVVVLRPSMVVPDSPVTPEILCGCIWPLQVMKECSALPVNPDAMVDFIPLSLVGEVTLAMASAELDHRCYHISAGREGATRWGDVTELLASAYRLDRPIVCATGDAWQALRAGLTRHEVTMMRSVACYFPFINQNVTYDNARLRAQLGAIDPARLDVRRYLPPLLDQVSLDAAIVRSRYD